MASSVFLPQSFSGLRCECACLLATRLGYAALNDASSAAVNSAVKFELVPAAAAGLRVPSCRFTVSVARSWKPVPVPLSVYATAHPCFNPHSPALPIAPYTPREPEDAAVTMQAFAALNDVGICTIIVTFSL